MLFVHEGFFFSIQWSGKTSALFLRRALALCVLTNLCLTTVLYFNNSLNCTEHVVVYFITSLHLTHIVNLDNAYSVFCFYSSVLHLFCLCCRRMYWRLACKCREQISALPWEHRCLCDVFRIRSLILVSFLIFVMAGAHFACFFIIPVHIFHVPVWGMDWWIVSFLNRI